MNFIPFLNNFHLLQTNSRKSKIQKKKKQKTKKWKEKSTKLHYYKLQPINSKKFIPHKFAFTCFFSFLFSFFFSISHNPYTIIHAICIFLENDSWIFTRELTIFESVPRIFMNEHGKNEIFFLFVALFPIFFTSYRRTQTHTVNETRHFFWCCQDHISLFDHFIFFFFFLFVPKFPLRIWDKCANISKAHDEKG